MKLQIERMVIVFLLILIAAMALQTCFRKQKQVERLETIVTNKIDTIVQWKDKAGREHGQKELILTNYANQIDSLKTVLQIKEKQIQSFTGVGTTNKGSVVIKVDTVYLPDSSHEYAFNFADKWLSLNGKIAKEPVIDYLITDSLMVTTFHKRKNFLSPYKSYIDVYSLNPKVKITGLTGFQIPVKKTGRFSIGPYVGYGYMDGKWQPSAGISLQYSLIRF